MAVDPNLTTLEREALTRAVSKVQPEWRTALLKQIDALRVTARTDKSFGYYADFECPSALRIADLPEDFNSALPEAFATHPDVEGGIFFLVYLKAGVINFMEVASTSDWPEDENRAVFAD